MTSKRSRKRRRGARRPATQPPAPKREPDPRRRGEPAERPRAPWGSFPLSELAILVGAFLLLLGFLGGTGTRQATLVVAGLAIASLGALEVSIREHLAGYRSHTLLLAAVPAVAVLGLLFAIGPDAIGQAVRLALAAAVYALAAWALTALFRSRSGTVFRVRAPRR